MFFQQTYSTLVVTAASKFHDAILPLLPSSEFDPVCFAGSISEARRETLARQYDFILICAPLPDDFGTRFAIDICEKTDCAVMLLLRGDSYEEITAKVRPYGVFTMQLPTSSQSLRQGLRWMAAARERLRQFQKKAVTVEEKMAEIRLVNRAKCLLIEKRGMTEAEAHRHIEKQSMDRCTSKKEIATEILKTYG